jgi:diaminopimelate epimerase
MTSGTIRLTKHHGLGNDFLVLVDPVAGLDAAALARHVCDRRLGVGADGLLIAHPGDASDGGERTDVVMELRNADGGRAEMSGNGIRCFAQAVWDAGLVADRHRLVVGTDAGVRVVRWRGEPKPGVIDAAVDMGHVKVTDDAPQWVEGTIEAAALVDAGNPHLVLLDPNVATVDVAAVGPAIEGMFPNGVNIEWVWPGPAGDDLTLRVWERGAGVTLACGTGSCAAVAAAFGWGRVGSTAVVHNPGGDVIVELGETATLIGPAVHVATVELPWP